MRYRNFFLLESWKNYIVSNNPETLLYDFYVLSYLTTLPISPEQKGFAGSLIGRDPKEIKMDIDEAENKLLPFLQKQLSDALFIAICAEIRHILDRRQNWENYKGNKLLTQYLRNYKLFSSNLPHELMPRSERPTMDVQQSQYSDSYKAAVKAIKDTNSTHEQFARLCADLFNNGNWDSSYGGPKWAEIAEAYLLLNKQPQTKQQLQIAIDHAYDLQHNTGTVLNKVSDYYIKGDITWLKKALDFKANLRSLYELLPKCSSDIRKLALEAFKTAGVKKEQLKQTTPPTVNKQLDDKSTKTGKKYFYVNDLVDVVFNIGQLWYKAVVIEGGQDLVTIQVRQVFSPHANYKVGEVFKVHADHLKISNDNVKKETDEQFNVGDRVKINFYGKPYYIGTIEDIIPPYKGPYNNKHLYHILIKQKLNDIGSFGVGETMVTPTRVGFGIEKLSTEKDSVETKIKPMKERYTNKLSEINSNELMRKYILHQFYNSFKTVYRDEIKQINIKQKKDLVLFTETSANLITRIILDIINLKIDESFNVVKDLSMANIPHKTYRIITKFRNSTIGLINPHHFKDYIKKVLDRQQFLKEDVDTLNDIIGFVVDGFNTEYAVSLHHLFKSFDVNFDEIDKEQVYKIFDYKKLV